MTHLDTLKAMREKWEAAWQDADAADGADAWVSATVAEAVEYVAALDAAIAALERLARVRAEVEALLSIDDYGFLQPPGDFDTVSRAAVLALLDREELKK